MQKTMIFAVLIYVVSFSSSAANTTSHLDRIKSKHPYALLGDDFGLLNENDLATNACEASPKPFSGEPYSSYPYWQCFPAQSASLTCDDTNFDPNENPRTTIMAVVIHQGGGEQEYLSRRAIELENCRWFQRRWKALTRKQSHVCLSGPFNSYERDEQGKKTTYWIFDKFKTLKGCVSYYHGNCDLFYLRKQGCQEN